MTAEAKVGETPRTAVEIQTLARDVRAELKGPPVTFAKLSELEQLALRSVVKPAPRQDLRELVERFDEAIFTYGVECGRQNDTAAMRKDYMQSKAILLAAIDALTEEMK